MMALPEMPFEMEKPPASDGYDRRLASRRTARLRCWCETAERDFYVRCLDVGRDGLFLQTLADLPTGTRIDVRLQLPAGEFSAHAEVVWQRDFAEDGPPPGLGLQFLVVNDRSLNILESYLVSYHA